MLDRMSTPSIIRCVASLGLLGSIGGAGNFYVVLVIRQTYFQNEPNGHLFAAILGCCLLAAYFIVCIRRSRFVWIMRAPERD